MPSKPAHTARKPKRKSPRPAGESAATLLEAVRELVREWTDKLSKRDATGEDANRLLYDVSEAAWPKQK